MKTFPHFAVAIENMLPAADESDQLEIRRMVDDAYQKINKAMFESLKVIAKESPAVMATQGQGDPEDKEALNYHILLIENMNHYIEEVDARTDSVLLDWKAKAQDEMKEHMDLYVDAVIRRPLGKLLVSNSLHPPVCVISLTLPRNSSSRQRRCSPKLAQVHSRLHSAHHTHAPSSRSSCTHTTPRRSERASKRSRSESTSILATLMTRELAAISSSRCSRNARKSTATCTIALSASIKMCTLERWRWIGVRMR